jgi:signal transduction histidine kinase
LPWAERQQRRSQAIAALAVGSQRSIPAWEEAAQLAARYLGVPMAVVTVANHHTEYFQAAYGLSSLGVGNPLSQQRHLPLESGLGLYVLDGEQPIVFTDTAANPVVAQSTLVCTYGIRAYCGVPLVTSQGTCLGTLAAMDVHPRAFTEQDIGFLAMAARWGMSEFERQATSTAERLPSPGLAQVSLSLETLVDTVRLALISQLTQDLRSPLATVLGMAAMLSREIYGPLTPKQREYTDIVHRSSQMLLALVDEMLELGPVETAQPDLVPAPVDIEVLGQQVLATLTPLAEASTQTLTLTVEPNQNQWILDQRTVKQILYHLIFSIMQVAGDNSTLRLHACRRGQALSLGVWLSNPWLGEGLPSEVLDVFQGLTSAAGAGIDPSAIPRPLRGLLLSQYLAQHHGGYLKVVGNSDSGCRLVVLLPVIDAAAGRAEVGHGQPETEIGRSAAP